MALRFVIGRSGSGKSTALYQYMIEQSMKHKRVNYLLITPDQFTLDTQKMVIGMHPHHGFMNIDILSFHRLAYKIFEELSVDPGVILEDFGKSMILQKILGKRKQELPLFRGNRDKLGFIDELKSLFSEFYQYGVTKDRLEAQLKKEKEGTLLYEKLKELLIVMEEFEAFLGQDYIVAEQLLTVLSEKAGESGILKNSVVILDGFTGFTPVQNELLKAVLPVCRDMYISVTLDEKEALFTSIRDYEMFAASKEILGTLKKAAKEQGIPVADDWVISGGRGRFVPNSELDYLERNLFRPGGKSYENTVKQIVVRRLLDPEEEALYAAREISRLVREEGLRYREIGIISGDLERYGQRMIRLLKEYDIPCFLDNTKGMRSHPLVECVRGVFALFEYDFHYEGVCHYVKNGMTEITKEGADALDHYLLATGLRGYGAFTGTFKRKPRRISEGILTKAEEARACLMDEMKELAAVFRKKKAKVKEYLEALYYYMVKMGYEQKMEEEAARFEEQGDYVFASAYSQVYEQLIHLLDKIAGILGEEELELTELRKIMDAGLEELKLGVIPPGPDQVVIGDVERTRLSHVKALFFLGVNEGIIPKPEKGGGILSDSDREALADGEFTLAPGARKNAGLEQFYLYLSLTRPSEHLYLTFALVDQEGKSIRPSYLIGRLKLLFPKLIVSDGMGEGKRAYYTKKSSLPYVRDSLNAWFTGEADKEDEALLFWLFGTDEGKHWIETALKGRFYTNEEKGLSLAAAKAIYGLHMEASVTRLESYAGCAFAHFLKYGLMLSKRQRYQIESADLGQILHKCMELFVKEAKERGRGIRFMDGEARDALAVECLRRAVEDYDSAIFHSSARNEACIERMERMVKRTAWALSEQLKNSDFEPMELEWRFQSRKDLEAVKLSLNHGGTLELQGIVDRIDCYEDEENLYLKVTDYKSGMKTFQLEDIYNGLSLQLVVYMNAAMEKARKDQEKQVVPAGIFYFHIQDPLVDYEEGISVEEELLSQFDLSGLVLNERDVIEHLDSGVEKAIPVSYKKDGTPTAASSVASRDQFETLGDYVKKKLIDYGNGILDGNIAILPYREDKRTACDYCDYKGVCGFDPAFSGNRYRNLRKVSKKDVWNRLEEGFGADGPAIEKDEEGR